MALFTRLAYSLCKHCLDVNITVCEELNDDDDEESGLRRGSVLFKHSCWIIIQLKEDILPTFTYGTSMNHLFDKCY